MRNYRHLFLTGLTLLGAATISSCVDDSYDLDNIDATIATTGDLWTPVNSTSDFILENVLDLDDTDALDTLRIPNPDSSTQGDSISIYCIRKKGHNIFWAYYQGGNDFKVEKELIDSLNLNLPDYLERDGLVLDVDNPMVFVKATSNYAMPNTELKLIFEATYEDNTKKPINIFANHSANLNELEGGITFCSKKEDAFIPFEYKSYQWWQLDMYNLIREVPDDIDILCGTIENNKDGEGLVKNTLYKVDVNYEIVAPLKFGKDFQLVYSHEETGWAEDLDDLEKVNVKQLGFRGKIDSGLPLNITLSLIPKDEKGNEIAELEVDKVNVAANAKNADIMLNIKAKEGYEMNDFITGKNTKGQKLDGIEVRAVLDNPNVGYLLRTNDKLKIYDARVGIVGGVTYDAN